MLWRAAAFRNAVPIPTVVTSSTLQGDIAMARMTAAEAAVRVMELEGITQAFGVPGAAINPLYSALRKHGSIAHILARHVEAASHMAEGYTAPGPATSACASGPRARPAPT
jgi:glyoxylate carboligase